MAKSYVTVERSSRKSNLPNLKTSNCENFAKNDDGIFSQIVVRAGCAGGTGSELLNDGPGKLHQTNKKATPQQGMPSNR